MKGLLIKNRAEKVSLAAYDYYGANFNVNIFDQDTNTFLDTNLAMSEGTEPVTSWTAALTEARTKGQEVISIDTIGDLVPGDRFNLGSYVYRVSEIDGTSITLHMPLKADMVGTETLTRVGNMGVYSLDLTVSQDGTFLVQAKDSVYGIMHSDAIKVNSKTIEEKIDAVSTEVEENQVLITTSKQGWKVLI